MTLISATWDVIKRIGKGFGIMLACIVAAFIVIAIIIMTYYVLEFVWSILIGFYLPIALILIAALILACAYSLGGPAKW